MGNADPTALVVANAAAQVVMFVGMPEAQLTLAQATAYLATAPKSNAATVAIGRAMEDIRTRGAAPVPLHLRDSHYPGAARLGHGRGYLYPHDFAESQVPQEYAPADARSGPYYEPVRYLLNVEPHGTVQRIVVRIDGEEREIPVHRPVERIAVRVEMEDTRKPE